MNIGNPEEFTLLELARTVIELTGSASEIVFEALPVNDPQQRRPDITRARELLGWEPDIALRDGLQLLLERSTRARPRRPDGRGVRRRLILAPERRCGALVAGPASAQAALQVGLMDPRTRRREPDAYWSDVDALRPAVLRFDVHWDEIAPTRPAIQRNPADPAYHWGYLDHARARRRGERLRPLRR